MRVSHGFSLVLLASFLGGCKATDAMDNTDTMKADLAAMKATTAGMAGTTEAMRKKTSDLERKASLGMGLTMMNAPENTREFTPPPFGLIAGAKLVAENATNDELIELYYVKLKELKAAPDESEMDERSFVGGFSPKYVADFNKQKQVKIVALEAIAAQIPPETLQELIGEQILGGGGRYSDTMYALLMLRAKFINDFYLDAGVFATKIDTLGKLRKAVEYTTNLQFLASLPFLEKIAFDADSQAFLPVVLPSQKGTEDEACSDPGKVKNNPECRPTLGDAPAFHEKLRVDIAKSWWKKIARKIENDLPPEWKVSNSPYAREIEEIKQSALRYAEQK